MVDRYKKLSWLKKRKLRKYIKSIKFDLWPEKFRGSGEHEALLWLKAYIEGRAGEPVELIFSFLEHSSKGLNSHDCSYLLTLLNHC